MRRYTLCVAAGVGKIKDTDLGLCQDGSGINKRGEAEWDRGSQ